MYLFFEEDGTFKVGTVLSQTGSAYQVELVTGRRTKVKGGHVFFEFESPAASEVMAKAEQTAAEMDPQFLWEVAPDGEFRFESLAGDYFGEEAGVIERIATLLTLHGHPVYFHRKGRGNYRKAPEEILKAALAAVEKKRLAEEQKRPGFGRWSMKRPCLKKLLLKRSPFWFHLIKTAISGKHSRMRQANLV